MEIGGLIAMSPPKSPHDSAGDQPPSCARAELSTRSRTAMMSYEDKRGFVSHARGACRSGKTHAGRGEGRFQIRGRVWGFGRNAFLGRWCGIGNRDPFGKLRAGTSTA